MYNFGTPTLTFDIETIPCTDSRLIEVVASKVKAPGTIKKAESIAKWEAEEKAPAIQEAVSKTSFDGGFGQIVSIAWKINDKPENGLVVTPHITESDVIWGFYQALAGFDTRPKVIGFNHVAFDLPFLFKRSIINRIRPHHMLPFGEKDWSERVYDVMTKWAGFGNRVSMDTLCQILGIDGKDGMSGDQVWPAIQQGRHQEVLEYCKDDVSRTFKLYQRMTNFN